MNNIKYIVYQEGKYFVSRAINLEVSSFGESIDEAIANLKEAVELYFEDNNNNDFPVIQDVMLGEYSINA